MRPRSSEAGCQALDRQRTALYQPHGWCRNRQGSEGAYPRRRWRAWTDWQPGLSSTGYMSSKLRASDASVGAAAQVGEATAGKTMIGGPFQLVDQNGKTFTDRCSHVQAGSPGLLTTWMPCCATSS